MKLHESHPYVTSPVSLTLTLLTASLIACGQNTGPTPAPEQPKPTTPPEVTPPSPTASTLLPLPSFEACGSSDVSTLPAKWTATALMEDFVLDTLWFGKFVYDEAARAFRFTLLDEFGIDFDLLVTEDGKLYRLAGEGDMPTSCTLLTNKSPFTAPTRNWLSDKAVCVGEAPLLERKQRWWKNPSGAGANWFWFNVDNGLPFRSMYYADAEPTTPVPIYEYFTFNYFPEFKPVAETNLAQIVTLCQAGKKAPTATEEFAKLSIEPLLKKSTYPKNDPRALERIKAWVPAISACASKDSLPPPWPDKLQVTAFMTAVSFGPNPFPTRIFYDWTQKAQNTTLYYNPPAPTTYAQTAYLLGSTGYIAIVEEGDKIATCQQVLPGPPVPDWKSVDKCECRAQIAPGTVLNPSDVPTKILWCPTDLEEMQVFWTWYSDTGVPVVFMQSNSSPTAGTGLNLADYTGWAPGSVAPSGTFDLPQACQGQPIVANAFPKECNDCHLPLNADPAAH